MYDETGVRLVVLGLNEARRQISSFDGALNELGRTIRTLDSTSATFSQKLQAVGDSFTTVGRQLTTSVTIPIVAAGAALLSFGIQFEDAFAGVSKTVDGVAIGFDEVAKAMFGTADGLTAAQKQAVFANESFGQLTDFGKELRQEFIDLSTEIPIASTELAKIGQVAGQLGVDKEQIKGFTEIVALLAETTSLASEDAAFAIARIGNIMGVSADQMAEFASQMGNAIVELGNNAAATETEIVNLSLRIAGAARAVGMSTPDVLGLSAALAAAGIRAEMGGSAVSRILTSMSYAANDFSMSGEAMNEQLAFLEEELVRLDHFSEGTPFEAIQAEFENTLNLEGFEADLKRVEAGQMSWQVLRDNIRIRTMADLKGDLLESQKLIKAIADVTGMSAEALVSLIRSDPTKAFQVFIGGLANLQEQGKLTSDQLTALEINTIRLKDVINRLGPNVGLVSDLVGMSNEEWVKQVALQEEAAKKFATTKNQLKLLFNEIKAFGTELFLQFSGPINALIKVLKEFVHGLRELPPAAKVTIATFAGIAAAIGPLLIVMGTLLKLTASSMEGFKLLPSLKLPNVFGGIFNSIKDGASAAYNGILKVVGGITGGITNAVGSIGKLITGTISSMVSVTTSTISSIFKTSIRIVKMFVSPLTSAISSIVTDVILLPFKLFATAVKGIVLPVLSQVASTAMSVFSTVGKSILGIASNILPVFGNILFTGITSIFTTVPLIIAAGLALAIGPDLIKAVMKNWDAVKSTLSASMKQFSEDVKNEGLFNAILLFMSGGSGGSGRTESMYGLAKAMGATEETARKFGWTLGEITVIVKDILTSIGDLITGLDGADNAFEESGNSTSRTGNIILGILTGIKDFLAGFFVGFTSTFREITVAFALLKDAFKDLRDAAKELFATIFGETEKAITTGNVYADSIQTDMGKAGKTAGEVIGELLTLGIQVFTVIVDVATSIVRGFTNLAKAYKDNGIKGIFDELFKVIGDIWNTLRIELVDIVRPKVDALVSWLSGEGVSRISGAALQIASAFGSAFNTLWEGWGERVAETQTEKMYSFFTKSGKLIGTATNEAVVEAFKKSSEEESFIDLLEGGKVSTSDISFGEIIAKFTEKTTPSQTLPGFEGLEKLFSDLFADISGFFTDPANVETFKKGFGDLMDALGVFIKEDVWKNHLEKPFGEMMTAFTTWVEEDFVPAVLDAVKRATTSAVEKTEVSLLEKLIPDADTMLRVGQALGLVGEGAGEDLTDGVERGIEDTAPTGDELYEKTFNPYALARTLELLDVDSVAAGKRFTTGIENGLSQGQAAMLLIADGVAVSAIDKFKEIFGIDATGQSTVAKGIGEGVVTGLDNGLTTKSPVPIKTIAGIGTKMTSSMRATLEASSPSRAFERIGNDIMYGLNNGINNLSGTVLGTVSTITQSIISSFTNMGNIISSTLANAQMNLNNFSMQVPGIVNNITSQVSTAISSAMSALSGASSRMSQMNSSIVTAKSSSYTNTSTQNNFAPIINAKMSASEVESIYRSWIREPWM